MKNITEIEANEFENHVKTEKYFCSFRWFYSYFEVNYIFPELSQEIDLPSWSHISNIIKIDKGYYIKVYIMHSDFLNNYEFILKYPILSFYDNIRDSSKFNLLRNL